GKIFLAFCAFAAITAVLGFVGLRSVDQSGRLIGELYDKPFMAVSSARLGLSQFMALERVSEQQKSAQDPRERDALQQQIDGLRQSVADDLKIAELRSVSVSAAEAAQSAQKMAESWHQLSEAQSAKTISANNRRALTQRAAVQRAFDILIEQTAQDAVN